MKRTSFSLLFCLVLCPTARTQIHISKGTVVVVGAFGNEVVIAADSRKTGDGRYFDDDCKISAYSHEIIVATSGTRSWELFFNGTRTQWDSHVVARDSVLKAKSLKKSDTDLVSSAARIWSQKARQWHEKALAADPHFLNRLNLKTNEVAQTVFAGKDNAGNVVAITARVSRNSSGQLYSSADPIEPGDGPIVYGVSEIAQEILAGKTQRAITAQRQWNNSVRWKGAGERRELFVIQLAKWTVQYGPTNVGGAVDAIKLGPSGVQWIERKSNCQQSE